MRNYLLVFIKTFVAASKQGVTKDCKDISVK